MKIAYKECVMWPNSQKKIDRINQIIAEYAAKGYSLTLRQVYYQLVARDIIPNTEKSYKNLGNLLNEGRLCGLISWQAIEDRTRNLEGLQHWDNPGQIIRATAHSYKLDRWENQDYRIEIWVEKDALKDIVSRAANKLDLPYFSCRGYVSQSEMWGAARRLLQTSDNRRPVIIHLGDHDPSGRDMSRDIVERLELFGLDPLFHRIALNKNQIEEFKPPPNPTKLTDSRAKGYIAEFGHQSWELDALAPEVIDKLITEAVKPYMDVNETERVQAKEEQGRILLDRIASDWGRISERYADGTPEEDESEYEEEDSTPIPGKDSRKVRGSGIVGKGRTPRGRRGKK